MVCLRLSLYLAHIRSSPAQATQTLHFPRNAKRVYPKFKKQLKKIAKHLNANPEAILVVTGHTDDTGPERVNRKLSLPVPVGSASNW